MENSPFQEEVSVLTWMDDLLDTRLSSMLRYDIVKTMELVPQGYDLRTADNFIWEGLGISEKAWQRIYANRDDEILFKSRRTGVVDFLRELLAEHLREPTGMPGRCPMKLTINTFPYYLTPEVKEAWKSVYREMIHPNLNIQFIRRTYGNLTPAYVMQHYNYLIHYDWDEWASAVGNSVEKASMTMLSVIGPRIWKHAPSAEEMEIYKDAIDNLDVHMLAEMAAVLVFQLRLVPVDLWVAYKDNHSFSSANRAETEMDVPKKAGD